MENSKKYYVYRHTCPNGKVYIGITGRNPSVRWANGKGYSNSYFYNAISKYGWQNIKHEILFDSLTKEEAEAKEIELIAEHKSNHKEYGYNIAVGGEARALKYAKALICPICKKEFKQKNAYTKYCSKGCYEKATAHNIEYNGETHTATEWGEILGVTRDTILYREQKGYDLAIGKPKNIKFCVVCGKEFTPKKRNAGLCCSSECAHEYQRKEKPKAVCLTCGKEFEVGRDRKGLYCSRECQLSAIRIDRRRNNA